MGLTECLPLVPSAWSRPAHQVLLWSGALLLSPLSPWPHWKEKMTKSVFFFNEMLLLEGAQASLVIAMSGPRGALWGAGRFGWHLQALVPSLPVSGGAGRAPPECRTCFHFPGGSHWPPPTCLPSPWPVPPWWCWAFAASARASSGHDGCSLSDWTLGLGVG